MYEELRSDSFLCRMSERLRTDDDANRAYVPICVQIDVPIDHSIVWFGRRLGVISYRNIHTTSYSSFQFCCLIVRVESSYDDNEISAFRSNTPIYSRSSQPSSIPLR